MKSIDLQQQLFDPDPLLDKRAAACRLGVGERFVTRLVNERRIAYVKVGKYVRIRTSTIDRYIASNTRTAATDAR